MYLLLTVLAEIVPNANTWVLLCHSEIYSFLLYYFLIYYLDIIVISNSVSSVCLGYN